MSPEAAALRRLTVLVGAAVLIDTTFYAVVAPLLPGSATASTCPSSGPGC